MTYFRKLKIGKIRVFPLLLSGNTMFLPFFGNDQKANQPTSYDKKATSPVKYGKSVRLDLTF